MKLKQILCILFVLALLSGCGLQAQTTNPVIEKPNDPDNAGDVNKPQENPEEPAPEDVKPTEDPYPVNEEPAVVDDPSALPVVISAIVPAEDGAMQIVTQGLNRIAGYAKLPVESNAILKADPRIDDAGNVYLLYGAKRTYLTKLGSDGSVDTKELDVYTVVNTLWVGESLLICQQNADKTLLVVNTKFETETVADVKCEGKWGISSGKMDKALWFLSSEEDGKTLISYHTFNPISKETSEGKLELPFVLVDLTEAEKDPEKRYLLDVLAVDSETENVIMTYLTYDKDGEEKYWLEVYDAKQQQVLVNEPGGSINHGIQFSGSAIYGSGTPGTEVITMARRFSDLSVILTYDDYVPKKFNGVLQWDWLATNGALWYRMNNEAVLIYDNQGTKLHEVENTLNISEETLRGPKLRIALPFYVGE